MLFTQYQDHKKMNMAQYKSHLSKSLKTMASDRPSVSDQPVWENILNFVDKSMRFSFKPIDNLLFKNPFA